MRKVLFYISQNYSFAILRPLQQCLIARGDQVCWFVQGESVKLSFFRPDENRLENLQQVFDFQADIVIAPANSIPGFIPGLKVCVFHGFDAGKLDSRGRNDHFIIRGCYDLYCTQGPNTTGKFKELQQHYGFFNVVETGWPALDPLFEARVNATPNARPVIFLGSTFTKRLTQARYIFPEVKRLSRSRNWRWIVSLHPKSDPEVIEMYRSISNDNLSYQDTDDMIPILQQADIMVGDTSSALTMFIVQNKPVVTTRNIDPQPYFINITDAGDLEAAIEQALTPSPDLMRNIAAYIADTHPYTDGQASQRVLKAIDELAAGAYPVKRKKPLNIIRNLRFRKLFNYWKF